MTRHFYLANSLWELGQIEAQLERQGLSPAQIHVVSDKGNLATRFHLQNGSSLLFLELAHFTLKGARIGAQLALLCLALASLFDVGSSNVGWPPFLLLSAILLGFCVWEGGLIGICAPYQLRCRYHHSIERGQHLMLVDVEQAQEAGLSRVLEQHPMVIPLGRGAGVESGAVRMQHWWLKHPLW
ncbi:hypothetical protein FCL40_13715 [Ferrimonas sediminicola]|uniref:Uncharacterized protein n=1 Tax=Ferrimonas sediminicola TaxID=2569538 RepID=A0A4U1BCH5_9GAMM|nr:hypothetical protein [Ferrimonas sediminicola]TKB48182.1 hypothetical protein FCL40_13715 [Ferrimonas sediminicola]